MKRVISVESVSKSFTGVQAVRDLSFEVDAGEIFALLGPNGAGKTSLVRMLVGILRPDGGRIRFFLDGTESPSVPPASLGYLPEERGLFRDTPVLRTLIYFGQLRGMTKAGAKGAAEEWLERFELADRARDRVDALSKGNQQRVQLISALLHEPDVAILDEPFSGLDPLSQELFFTVLREIREQGRTILLSAHQMDLVERTADRVLLMHHGAEVLSGSLADIRATEDASRKLVVRFGEGADVERLSAIAGVERCDLDTAEEATLWLSGSGSLSPVLSEVARDRRIEAIHSERTSLHDLFVQAVGREGLPREGRVMNDA